MSKAPVIFNLTTAANLSTTRVSRLFAELDRAMWRLSLTPGERHVDSMCRQVAGKPDAALRLEVAAFVVRPVLDGEWSA